MALDIPQSFRFTKQHEWISPVDEKDQTVLVGISDFAQSQLGDVVFVELPEKGSALKKGEAFGVVESIKSVSDLYAPVSGEVVGINEALSERPEQINEGPYDSWIIKVKLDNESELGELLSAKDYEQHCQSSEA